jgi:PRTRC genetic system ThiF family protein
MNKEAVHFTASYLLRPTNPVTVNVVGAGGNGNLMLTALARMNAAMTALGHPGLQVRLFDADTISAANLARQLFTTEEQGLNKAVVLMTRMNRFFGTNWSAYPYMFDKGLFEKTESIELSANITISCVDTVAARYEIAKLLMKATQRHSRHEQTHYPLYWLDLGNSRYTGQVILSTLSPIKQPTSQQFEPVAQLPLLTEEFDELLRTTSEADSGPSCSLAEALEKQDLFINSAVVNAASSLLWTLFRKGMTTYRGVFLNVEHHKSLPLKIATPGRRKKSRKKATLKA